MSKEYAFDYYSAYGTTGSTTAVPKTRESEIPKIKKNTKTKSKTNSILFAVLIAVVFVVVFRYTLINEINSNNTKLENKLNAITTEADIAKLSLDKTTDLNYVETVAKEKLHMDFPQSHQVTNVTLIYPDKVSVSQTQSGSIISAIGNFFSGIVEYLY